MNKYKTFRPGDNHMMFSIKSLSKSDKDISESTNIEIAFMPFTRENGALNSGKEYYIQPDGFEDLVETYVVSRCKTIWCESFPLYKYLERKMKFYDIYRPWKVDDKLDIKPLMRLLSEKQTKTLYKQHNMPMDWLKVTAIDRCRYQIDCIRKVINTYFKYYESEY